MGGGRDKPATRQRMVVLDTPLQPKLHKIKENDDEFSNSKHKCETNKNKSHQPSGKTNIDTVQDQSPPVEMVTKVVE